MVGLFKALRVFQGKRIWVNSRMVPKSAMSDRMTPGIFEESEIAKEGEGGK